MLRVSVSKIAVSAVFCFAAAFAVDGQKVTKTFTVSSNARIEIVNRFGRVDAAAPSAPGHENVEGDVLAIPLTVSVTFSSTSTITEKDLDISTSPSVVRIEANPAEREKRIDISVSIPAGLRLKIETGEGEVRFSGIFRSVEVRSGTGTIAGDFPTYDVRYSLLWTASRPRFLSDFQLEEVKERSGGRFSISGSYSGDQALIREKSNKRETAEVNTRTGVPPIPDAYASVDSSGQGGSKKKGAESTKSIKLDLETARGIILLNIPPNEVSSDLRERPLTNAAKAIIRSGDSLLMEAIRRAAPKYYGDYARTLPPLKLEPRFADRPGTEKVVESSVKTASVRVSDADNRAVGDLAPNDFEVFENGVEREVLTVRRSSAPFNLVLLLDVSGSIDNYVDFIRKAARSFINTVGARDRIAIVTFNDDVNVLAKFTTDKAKLSKSLDTFDAGGATAYYDALAYTLADTLRPLKGERTAVVILTDGDDNRSFLPFDSMLASIQESGAMIYPLYVPSGLVATSQSGGGALDMVRRRYLQGELTSKAKDEGKRLAEVSGGVYYQIAQLSQIEQAYEDIVGQLRTAYDVDYRSQLGGADGGVSPRLKIRAKRPNSYVQIRSVVRRPGG